MKHLQHIAAFALALSVSVGLPLGNPVETVNGETCKLISQTFTPDGILQLHNCCRPGPTPGSQSCRDRIRLLPYPDHQL